MFVRDTKPSRAYITAVLVDKGTNQVLTKEMVKRRFSYRVCGESKSKYGDTIMVIAGPHADYDHGDVFTCMVHPPRHAQFTDEELPFFNVMLGGWGNAVVEVELEA
jgi:hypothetical protein